MANKKYLCTYEDFLKTHINKTMSPEIAELFRNYAWQAPHAFLALKRIDRIAEIGTASGEVLKYNLTDMQGKFERAGITRNEIAKIKQVLFDKYPDIQRRIKRIPVPR